MAESRSQPLMRAVNDDVRKAVHADAFDRIPFFCECSDQACYQPLWLTLAEYDRLVAGNAFGLAPGHIRRRNSRRLADRIASPVPATT
jgi:hypothetical protein